MLHNKYNIENCKSILKPGSFGKYEKINLVIKDTQNVNFTSYKKIYEKNQNTKYQDDILNILEELREFDNKNGTSLFKNIIYNDLKNFILRNNF